jgi:hypothetical protein
MVKSEILNLENEVVMKSCQAPKKWREKETKDKDQSPGKQTAQNRQLFLELSLKLYRDDHTKTYEKLCRISHISATVNQHPSVHHPLDACYYSVVDEPQLS